MDEKDKLIWYEIAIDVIPSLKEDGTKYNKFYVEVNEYTQYSDGLGNMRYSINPRIGKYNKNNRRSLFHNFVRQRPLFSFVPIRR